MRGFQKVSRVAEDATIRLPERSTAGSAGYDFFMPEEMTIRAGGSATVRTGIKAYMMQDEALFIYPRSSLGIKKGLMLKNTVGVIDSDYHDNPDNEGEILVALQNMSENDVVLERGSKFVQGIFKKVLLVEDDSQEASREGGIGSTGS